MCKSIGLHLIKVKPPQPLKVNLNFIEIILITPYISPICAGHEYQFFVFEFNQVVGLDLPSISDHFASLSSPNLSYDSSN